MNYGTEIGLDGLWRVFLLDGVLRPEARKPIVEDRSDLFSIDTGQRSAEWV